MKPFMLICLMFICSVIMAEDMSSILVVIDMQKDFTTSKSSIAYIKKLVKEYKTNERPVLFVKSKNYGDVYEELMDEVKDYSYYLEVEKNRDDGSEEIMDLFQQKNINPNTITIVGINTCCCVADTVIGLNNKIPSDSKTQIVVDPQGCHCHGHYHPILYVLGMTATMSCVNKEEQFNKLSELSHVKVKSYDEAPKRKQKRNEVRNKSISIWSLERFVATKEILNLMNNSKD